MASEFLRPKKHVIILGAGASINSGYPDATRLTVLMCDKHAFLNELLGRLRSEGELEVQFQALSSPILRYYDSFHRSVRLLRSGDFATMDELSNLALGGRDSSEILKLKKLMRFVFGLTNPHRPGRFYYDAPNGEVLTISGDLGGKTGGEQPGNKN
jgi:hypothetical protein